MAYTTNVPLANQRISATQQPIQDNFIAIKTLIDVNHGTFGSAEEGKHIKISVPASSPAPTFSGSDIGLYGFVNAITGVNELYVRNAGNVTYPLTAGFSDGTQGWCFNPNGKLVKWGLATANSAITNFTIPSGSASTGPAFSLMHAAQITTLSLNTTTATDVNVQLVGINIGSANTIRLAPTKRTSTAVVTPAQFYYFIIGAP